MTDLINSRGEVIGRTHAPVETRKLELQAGHAYAIDTRAIGELVPARKSIRPTYEYDGVAIVSIAGPLTQRAGAVDDSYEEIIGRVAAACFSEACAVVLELSTPGGDAAGCIEASRKIRAICQLAGKPVYAWVLDRANSAGYALACAADRIILSESGIVGSIGIIATRTDTSKATAAAGVAITYFASGARKADGYADAPLTEPESIASQRLVDSLAGVFFGLVKERRGVDAKALDAGVFHGVDAVSAGLADSIMSLDALITLIKSGPVMDDKEEARKALQKLASGDGPDAKRAAAALAAFDKSDEPDAATPDDEPADDASKDDAKAIASRAMKMAASAQAEVHRMRVESQRAKAADERGRLLASRPDFDRDLVATLSDPSCPIATVKHLVATLPRALTGATASAALAATGATPTMPDASNVVGPRLSAEAKLELDRRMGVVPTKPGVASTEFTLQLGVPVADAGKAKA